MSETRAKEKLSLILSREQIAEGVRRLACQIRQDYQGRRPLLVGVLKGSFVFLADLVRELNMPLEVDFIRMASYGSGRRTTGKVRLVQALHSPVKGRDLLMVDDIVDSGRTTRFLLEYLQKKRPASLRLCALLDKKERREVYVRIHYRGFPVPNKFLVGYGLDFNQEYRQMPDIYALEEDEGGS